MITNFSVQNYKALRDIALELTPIHALVGPNDSGKSSILSALEALSRSTETGLQRAFHSAWEGRELVWHGEASNVVRFSATLTDSPSTVRYSLACRFPSTGRRVVVEEEKIFAESE